MKTLTLILSFFISLNAVAVAPYGIKGQNQSSTLYSNVHQFPNNQVTNIGGINALVETGNKNILVNPDFEHSTFNNSWTNVTVTPVVETTDRMSGKKSTLMAPSAQTFEYYQDSTLYAASLQGSTQLLAMVWIRTNQSGIKVCSRNDGVTSTTNCVIVAPQSPSVWQLVKVPFISSSTSNGISIAASNSITGNVYIDDAFVGAVDLKQDVDQSRIAGESFFAGTASCAWSRTSASVGAFTATAACLGPTVVYSSMGTWLTTDSDLPRQTINNLPSGVWKATFFTESSGTSSATSFAINDGTTTCEPIQGSSDSANRTPIAVSCTFIHSSSGNRVFELYTASAAGTVSLNNTLTSPRASVKFQLEYFGSGQIYSASCGANCVDEYVAELSSTGTISRENIDWISGNCTNASPAVCTLSLTLQNPMICHLTNAATGEASSGNIVATTSTISIQLQSNLKQNLQISCSKTGADFVASRTIVGSFSEVVTSKGVSKPSFVSLEVSSAGVVTQDDSDFVNGNCVVTDTSLFTCTWNTNYWLSAPKCQPNVTNGSQNFKAEKESIPTITSGVFRTANSTTGAKAASGFTLFCHGSIP